MTFLVCKLLHIYIAWLAPVSYITLFNVLVSILLDLHQQVLGLLAISVFLNNVDEGRPLLRGFLVHLGNLILLLSKLFFFASDLLIEFIDAYVVITISDVGFNKGLLGGVTVLHIVDGSLKY